MQAVKRMGSLSKMLGMLPGAGQMKEAINSLDDRDIDRIASIIQSMTPAERQEPKILNGSRRARIAAGSGRTVSDVNQLVDRFAEAQKMMRQVSRGGGVPGMPGLGGAGGRKQKAKGGKKAKRGSGNPAKRAAQAAGLDAAATEPGAAPAGLPDDFELPAAFKDLLPPS